MSGSQNGGGGGCLVLSIGNVKHTHAVGFPTDDVRLPIRLAFDPPTGKHQKSTNGGGGGCIRLKVGEVEHAIPCKPTDSIELEFDFLSK